MGCPPPSRRPVMSSAAGAFRLGQRVHAAGDPGRVGTVRYLGPIEGHAGDWVGFDWDDGAGGRHDGSLAGRRGGTSLPDALRLRYRVQDFTNEEQDEMYVFSASQKRVSVEFVGTDKVQEKLNNFNELPTLDGKFVQGFNTLRLLNLEDITLIHGMNFLEQLHLNNNRLKHVKYPSNLSPDGPLEMQLLCRSNDIDDFCSVDSLNLFPSLRDVRLSDNPIADPAKGGAPRFLYIRLVMGKIESNDPEEIKRLHPRFAELKFFHGIEDSSTSLPQKMASGLMSVTLKCVGPSIGEKQPLTKKLPATTTGCPLPQLLEEDTASLMELGIGSGATIYCCG
ncbi:hypothetical protein SORBI_3009G156400 [Sorghum bicolor]|uniref:CAP-Gly domain-containing protein n=1 Tax=Sorghum bicolor TaxID=4558 RepID=A0A1B6P8Z0_SORBI|nr:hypothetical protein SORBI_3009G156400 [Sorghum bicolor]